MKSLTGVPLELISLLDMTLPSLQQEDQLPINFATAPFDLISQSPVGCRTWLDMRLRQGEVTAVELVAMTRVPPLRDFDQISMHAGDLLRQVKLIAPYLKGKRVLFLGDNDGASRLIGLLGICGFTPLPEQMVLLDFDERILDCTRRFADKYGFGDRLETLPYNAFDAPPADLVGSFDWFYINPPYGRSNGGQSACLFMLRGMEMCVADSGQGCIIIPDAHQAPWTQEVMKNVQSTLLNSGWLVRENLEGMHHYHLADAPDLTSGTLLARQMRGAASMSHKWQGVPVPTESLPLFYGTKVPLPFPRYIRLDGTFDTDWEK